MTVPTPREFERKLKQAHLLLTDAEEAYRWAHSHGMYRSKLGAALGTKPKGGDDADEVGGIVLSKDKAAARRAMTHAGATMDEVISALRSITYTLGHALPEREPMPTQLERALVTRSDLQDSQAAKARREMRGEGWGDG